MSAAAGCLETGKGGLRLFVRLTPKAAVDRIEGVIDGADGRRRLAARVRAVPEKGRANAALERLLAQALGIARGDVKVGAGTTSRLKTVMLAGDAAAIAERIEALAARAP